MNTKEEISSVRKFMLKRFPTDEYMDCPVPKEYWPIIQEYSDQENARLTAIVSKYDELIECYKHQPCQLQVIGLKKETNPNSKS